MEEEGRVVQNVAFLALALFSLSLSLSLTRFADDDAIELVRFLSLISCWHLMIVRAPAYKLCVLGNEAFRPLDERSNSWPVLAINGHQRGRPPPRLIDTSFLD